MAPARGGRGGRGGRSGPSGDAFSASLRSVLADALDVDADRLEVSVRLDGSSVPADRIVGSVGLIAGAAEEPDEDSPRSFAPRSESDEDRRESGGASGHDSGRDAERGSDRDAERESQPVTAEELDEEAEAAADLLEGLLDAMKVDGDLRINVLDTHAEVEIVGADDGVLIGRRGQTLEAIQDLVRTAMQRRFERRSRVMVDVDGYRARRIERLLERADEAVQEVLASGEPQRLEPMDAIERRLVHQRVASHSGVISTSHGREPARRIVIELADDE